MLLTPPPVANCHTISDPLHPSSVTYFMDGPYVQLRLGVETRSTRSNFDQIEVGVGQDEVGLEASIPRIPGNSNTAV